MDVLVVVLVEVTVAVAVPDWDWVTVDVLVAVLVEVTVEVAVEVEIDVFVDVDVAVTVEVLTDVSVEVAVVVVVLGGCVWVVVTVDVTVEVTVEVAGARVVVVEVLEPELQRVVPWLRVPALPPTIIWLLSRLESWALPSTPHAVPYETAVAAGAQVPSCRMSMTVVNSTCGKENGLDPCSSESV